MRRALLGIAALAMPVVLAAQPIQASPATAIVTIMHGLPPSSYDIYVNGKLLLDGFQAEAATDPLSLPPGKYDVAIRNVGAPADSTPVLAGSVTLQGLKNYTVIAHPMLDGKGTISLFTNNLSRIPAGESRLVVRDVAQAPALDLSLGDKTLFSNLSGIREASKLLKPGKYSVAASTSGSGDPLLDATPLTLHEGAASVVYVVGSTDTGTLDFMFQEFRNLSSSPGGVPTGSGGLAAEPGFPAWAIGLLLLAVAGAAGSIIGLRRDRRVEA